jgi:hypothetical protein
VAYGRDPASERRKEQASVGNTLRSVTESYLTREGIRLRTAEDRRAAFERLVYPSLGARQIESIRRSEIVLLLDTIEDENGPRMASLTLAYLRRVMNWHATRADDFHSPIVRGMSKERGVANKRDRVLTDQELRAFWRASEAWAHQFGRMLQFILLTATRRDEAAHMQWAELRSVEGKPHIWTIPAARYKTNLDFELPLSHRAWQVLNTTPVLAELRKSAVERGGDPEAVTPKQGFVFTSNGMTGLGGFSKFKKVFDALMLEELRKASAAQGEEDPARVTLERWTIHDLRRTARSLMTRAGVSPDHAERALGHVVGGVRGVYDRHDYADEKREAFEALAAQIERVLNPEPNVVPMRKKRG